MKGLIVSTLALGLVACDSKTPTAESLRAEQEQLERERAALVEEKERAVAEEILARQRAEATAEAKRLAAERQEFEDEKQQFADQQAKLEIERSQSLPAASDSSAKQPSGDDSALLGIPANTPLVEASAAFQPVPSKEEEANQGRERADLEARARETAAKLPEKETAPKRTTAFFFAHLSSQGDWHDTDRHGFAWRPKRAAIDPEWRPYTDGRWQWTENGWTWQSHEPYGWAVYHYGRWFRHPKVGWLWVPGHEWAPAWVAWRMKGSEHAGWAPLPPSAADLGSGYGAGVDRDLQIPSSNYVFLPIRDFDELTYVHKFVDSSRRMEMLRGSRSLTRLERRNVAGGSMVLAGGPDPGLISSVIREDRNDAEARPFPQLNLVLGEEAPAQPAGDVVEAGAMLLFAPKIEKVRHGSKPERVQETLMVPDRDGGWADMSPEYEAEWRSMLEREAAQAAAAALAAKQPRRLAPVAQIQPAVAAKPAPAPQRRMIAPPSRPNPLNPSSLQPATGLSTRR